jgi:predicted GNAT family N-acyltransferase
MADDQRQETIKVVQLEDETEVSYILRGLSESEIGPWAAFCASVFAYKANPPTFSYFESHYRNDPNREASLIRVAFSNNQMVASVRVFLRSISDGQGGIFQAGGIGEVCTHSDHRRRGLSKFLLHDAIEIMKTKRHNLQVSLLHAAPEFFPVYEKAGGYVCCTTSRWSVVSIIQLVEQQEKQHARTWTPTNNDTSYSVREAQFPDDTEHMQKLHQTYSERRFAGCIIRTKDYWNDYLSKELVGSLFVLEQSNNNGKELVVAWLSIRSRGGRYQLREFGLDSNQVTATVALPLLLGRAMKQLEDNANDGVAVSSRFDLALPTAVLDEIRPDKVSFVDWSTETLENDIGWMYKTLREGISGMDQVLKSKEIPHLIWPADSF